MPNPTQLVRDATPIEERVVVHGHVVPPVPKATGEKLFVILPEFSPPAVVGPCEWVQAHGSTLPVEGTQVAVAFDDTGEPWVVAFEGKFTGGGGGKEPGEIKLSELKTGFHKLSETEERKLSALESPKLSELPASKLSEIGTRKLSELESSKLSELGTHKHSELEGLTEGDPHTQYALLAGRAGNQELQGGTAEEGSLTLGSTANATKGKVFLGAAKGSVYEESHERVGLHTTTPEAAIHVLRPQSPPFEASEPEAENNGEAGLRVVAGRGGNSTVTTGAAFGGIGGVIEVTSGEGGQVTVSTGSNTGGEGGVLRYKSGKGGSAKNTAATKNIGGLGGEFSMTAGGGGEAGKGASANKGGQGGTFSLRGGPGGEAAPNKSESIGGEGGSLEVVGGIGAPGQKSGAGGEVRVESGKAGARLTAAAWVEATEYALEALVSEGGKAYVSIKTPNKANKPSTSPTFWKEVTLSTGASGDVILRAAEKATSGTAGKVKVGTVVSSALQLAIETREGPQIGLYGVTPVARFGKIAAVTNPGAFKKGAQGFETEAEAKAVIEKLEALTKAVNELRESSFKIGITTE